MAKTTAAQTVPPANPTEAPFYISATQSATRPRSSLKHNDTFLVLDSHGDIGVSADAADGLFHCDTRFLSRLELRVNDAPPLLLGSNLRDDNASLAVDLTNPDLMTNRQITLEKDTLHILRTFSSGATPPTSVSACATMPPGRWMSEYLFFLPMISPTCSRCAAPGGNAAGRKRRSNAVTIRYS